MPRIRPSDHEARHRAGSLGPRAHGRRIPRSCPAAQGRKVPRASGHRGPAPEAGRRVPAPEAGAPGA